MLQGKEILLNIINNTLLAEQTSSDVQQLAFDNTELNAFLSNFKNPTVDIVHLTDNMLSNIIKHIKSKEEQKSFEASIKYIKGLIDINKEKSEEVILSTDQLLILSQLEELIKIAIESNEYLMTHLKERANKPIDDYRKILTVIQTEQVFTDKDYDIVENIVRTEINTDVENKLDKIFTYLNEFNSRKFKRKDSEKVNKRLMTNDVFESVIRTTERPTTDLEKAERTQKIKEVISFLGYNYEKLNIELKLKLISVNDLEELEKLIKYVTEEKPSIIHSIKEDNIYGLIYILVNSTINIIENIINILETQCGIKLSSAEFKKIINTATIIFSNNGFINFEENVSILSNHDISFKNIVRDNISLLSTNPKNLNKLINKLIKKGVNIKDLINNSSILLNPRQKNGKTYSIENNIDILEMYGFDIDAFFKESNPAYSILNSKDLSLKIDQFVEIGLNDEIHKDTSKAGSILKTLIIKRVYYSYKNNYKVWDNKTIENNLYIKEILESDLIMSDTEIEKIKSFYPVMEVIDEGYRSAIYTDAPMGLLKRRTEFVFGTQIISRPKVFKIFKILSDLNIPLKEALHNAVIYNSVLEPHESVFINDAINKIGDEEEYDRLLKEV